MADGISTFTIAVDGDATDLRSVISSIKTDFSRAVADLQSTTRKIDLFEGGLIRRRVHIGKGARY